MRFRSKSLDAYADAVGYLCRYVADIRAAVGDEAWQRHIPVIRDAQPFSGPWIAAVRAVHEAAEQAGIPGGMGLGSTMGDRFPCPGPKPPAGWVCPDGRCGKTVVQDPACEPAPPDARWCELTGQPMRRVG